MSLIKRRRNGTVQIYLRLTNKQFYLGTEDSIDPNRVNKALSYLQDKIATRHERDLEYYDRVERMLEGLLPKEERRRLPEAAQITREPAISRNEIRRVVERYMKDLRGYQLDGSISSFGLFGSWSRGDAVSSSDVDVLVVNSRDFDYEYVERAKINDYFLDLDNIPEKWIKRIPPVEIDQKLYEVQVLYERSGTLTNAKYLMSKIYWEPERVEMRTENYVMEADMYLSRAQSAYSKNDFQSAKVYATIGIETLMKILIEVNKLPISNSRFIAAFEESARKMGMYDFYEDYVGITGFSGFDRQRTENVLNSFSDMWRKAAFFIGLELKSVHGKVEKNLNYYKHEGFLEGMSIRTESLIEDGLFSEAAHYMFLASVDMLENYAWLVSTIEGTRFPYTALFQYLENSRASPKDIYDKAVETLGVKSTSGSQAEDSLKKAREIMLSIRQRRREIITRLSRSPDRIPGLTR